MSRRLPSDCVHITLSYLSLDDFNKHIPNSKLWNTRFYLRYGQKLKGNYKMLYLLRAATEYHEVCVDSLNSHFEHFQDLVCYHAATAKNWTLLHSFSTYSSLGHLVRKHILSAAIDSDQIEIVKKFFSSDYKLDVEEQAITFSPRMLELLLHCDHHKYGPILQAQIIANLPFEQCKTFIKAENLGLITQFAQYTRQDLREKLELMQCYRLEAWVGLFFNELTTISLGCINSIAWFATKSLGDWLADFDEDYDFEYFSKCGVVMLLFLMQKCVYMRPCKYYYNMWILIIF